MELRVELARRYDLDYLRRVCLVVFVDSIPPMSPQYLEDSKSKEMSHVASKGTPGRSDTRSQTSSFRFLRRHVLHPNGNNGRLLTIPDLRATISVFSRIMAVMNVLLKDSLSSRALFLLRSFISSEPCAHRLLVVDFIVVDSSGPRGLDIQICTIPPTILVPVSSHKCCRRLLPISFYPLTVRFPGIPLGSRRIWHVRRKHLPTRPPCRDGRADLLYDGAGLRAIPKPHPIVYEVQGLAVLEAG